MSYIGNNKIGKMYLGDTEIAKAYLGDDLVYQNGGGPTPPTPTPVFYDYLYFDGVAYIDTDIVPPASASLRCSMGMETTKAAQRYFGAQAANSTSLSVILSSSTTSTQRSFSIYYCASSAVSTGKTLPFSNSSFAFFLTPKRFGWGNTSYTFTKGSNTVTGGLVLGINQAHAGQPYTGRMGTFRIYDDTAQDATSADDLLDNYTSVYTLRPCTYNGEAGFWCEELSKFYGNTAGAGTLTASNS